MQTTSAFYLAVLKICAFIIILCSPAAAVRPISPLEGLRGNKHHLRTQKPEPKLTQKVEASDKYGEGGTLETTSDELSFLVTKQVWKNKKGEQKETHVLKDERGNEVWVFHGVEVFTYNPKSKEMSATDVGGIFVVENNVEPSQFREWMEKFGAQIAKDGTYSKPWKETPTTVEQPKMPPTEVFKPKTDQPSIDPDRPSSPSTDVFNPAKNTNNEPKKEEAPKKDEPPKTDKTSTGGGSAASTAPFTTPGYEMKLVFEDGLLRVRETTPFGQITLNMPGDLLPGQPFSGTIYLDPAGKTVGERAQNQLKLGDLSFRMQDGSIFNVGKLVGDKPWESNVWPWSHISRLTPAQMAHYRYLSWISGDIPVSGADLPYQHSAPSPPTSYTVPTGAQSGSFFTIPGPFDGTLSKTDYVEIGGERIPIISESPNSRVLWNTSPMTGEAKIEISENGLTGTCRFNNVSVKLSAPKLQLLRGETTTLTVVVSGLEGLTQDVPFELVNHSPAVVSMEGGNTQNLLIRGDTSHASDVQRNGTYTTTRTLTGVTPGTFNITAIVHWKETCKPSMEVMRIPKSTPVTNAGSH